MAGRKKTARLSVLYGKWFHSSLTGAFAQKFSVLSMHTYATRYRASARSSVARLSTDFVGDVAKESEDDLTEDVASSNQNQETMAQYRAMQELKRSSKTLLKYRGYLKRLGEHFAGKFDCEPLQVKLEDINPEEVLVFITSQCKTKEGKSKSVSVPEAYRSSILYYYRSVINRDDHLIPREYLVGLSNFVKGMRNHIADERQAGNYKTTEGKEAVEFEQLQRLCFLAACQRYY